MFTLRCGICERETNSLVGRLCPACDEAAEKAAGGVPLPPLPIEEGWVKVTPEGGEMEDYWGCEEFGLVVLENGADWRREYCTKCEVHYDPVYVPRVRARRAALAERAREARREREERAARLEKSRRAEELRQKMAFEEHGGGTPKIVSVLPEGDFDAGHTRIRVAKNGHERWIQHRDAAEAHRLADAWLENHRTQDGEWQERVPIRGGWEWRKAAP